MITKRAVPASAEPIIVDRMLWKMSQLREGIRAANADTREANELFFAGAPDLTPEMRHVSAEDYLATAREPITKEEWDRRVHENPPPRDDDGQWIKRLRSSSRQSRREVDT